MTDSRLPDYKNTGLSFEQRARDIVRRMTLDEKISQMIHNAPAIDRLGVPAYNWWNECLHGVARAGLATVFPQAIGMAASFDIELFRKTAIAISDEARAKHHDALKKGYHGQYFGLTYWTPNINIFRDPRWGRGHETYGEDPYLTSRFGVEFVKAVQGDDPKYLKIIATPKHYAVHSGPEKLRHEFNAEISKRDLYETYLRAFKDCITLANAQSVMPAYNAVYGQPCAGSKFLLQEILRDKWGFDGYVVSDCWAICDFHLHHKITSSPQESAAMAVINGCDLNCGNTYPRLLKANQEDLITEQQIDTALNRLFTARFRLGMFDDPEQVPYSKIPINIVACDEHRQLALQMARKSIVLLKNENNTLPLNKDRIKSIAVIGPNAMDQMSLLANYYGYPRSMVTPLEGILNTVSPGTQVTWDSGSKHLGDQPLSEKSIGWAIADSDVIIAVLGLSPRFEGEEAEEANSDGGGDRNGIEIPQVQQKLLRFLHKTGKPVILVIMGGSVMDISWAKDNIPAIIMAWYPGEQGGQAIADVLFGNYNPAGRLPVTFYANDNQLPDFCDYNMAGRTYRFFNGEPAYQFGHGLSYTTFGYSDIRLSKDIISSHENVAVTAKVTNTGDISGDEVVHMYIKDIHSTVPVPQLHLEGFRRINLKPGHSHEVTFTITPEQLAVYDDEGNPFVEAGEFLISIGGSQPSNHQGNSIETKLMVS
jgi:beta-glucosidase